MLDLVKNVPQGVLKGFKASSPLETPWDTDLTKSSLQAVYQISDSHLNLWEIYHRHFSGLAELALKKYKSAAKHFLQAQFDHFEYKEVRERLQDLTLL